MSYRLQLPRLGPAPQADIVVTPEVSERRRLALKAFADQLRRLAILFPNGLGSLETEWPDIWAEINVTEESVDRVALRYIAGSASKEAFDRAMRAHEQAWRRGAEALARAGSGGGA